MPKFHLQLLPSINANNDYHIELDNIPYNEHESYSQVSSIFFSNKYGSIKLNGFFDLSNKNIPSLIKIYKLYFEISKQLLNTCIYSFSKYKQEIEFYFDFNDINKLKKIEEYLLKEYNLKIDYNNRRMYIVSNKLKNIDIIHKIGGKTDEENLKFLKPRKKIKNLDEENIDLNYDNDENMQNQNIDEESESLNNIEMEDISNPFIHISDKIEEKKIETMSEANLNIGLQNSSKNYIKIKDIEKISESKNLIKLAEIGKNLNNITDDKIKNSLKKLISEGAKFMKDNIKTNVLNSMDINGSYLLLDKSNDKYGNNYKFSLNNIILNSDISNNAEDLTDYKK